jgi:hypothetical protein
MAILYETLELGICNLIKAHTCHFLICVRVCVVSQRVNIVTMGIFVVRFDKFNVFLIFS